MSEEVARPSSRSLFALDSLYFLMADVKDGLGPFLAVYLAAAHHWGPDRVGVAVAAMGLAGLVSQTPAGALIDHVRDRRWVVIAALALVAAGMLAMVARPTPPVVFASQVLIGVAGASFGPALAAISLGLVGRSGLAGRMGRNSALDHAGNVVAAALIGLVGERLGYGAIFVLVAALCGCAIVAASLIRAKDVDYARARGADDGGPADAPMFDREVDPTAPVLADKAGRISAVGDLLRDRRILAFAASVVLFHFANAAMLPLVGQELAHLRGAGHGAAGSMSAAIVAAQLVMVPVALLASRFAESWGRKPTFLIGFAILPIRGVLYTLGQDPRYLIAVQLLDGVGAGIFGVVGVLVVADLTRGTGRFNLMQGALATATGLGASLSNLATGVVVKAAGFDAGFLMLAGIAALALIFFALAMPETRPSGGRPAGPSDHAGAVVALDSP